MQVNLNSFGRIKWSVGSLISWLILSCFSFSFQEVTQWMAPASADTLTNPFAKDTLAYLGGKKIFESTCWTCHGKSGKGNGPAAKSLTVKPADHTSSLVQKQSDGSIFWKIAKGRGQMAPYEKAFSKAQRWKLVMYIRKLGQTGGVK